MMFEPGSMYLEFGTGERYVTTRSERPPACAGEYPPGKRRNSAVNPGSDFIHPVFMYPLLLKFFFNSPESGGVPDEHVRKSRFSPVRILFRHRLRSFGLMSATPQMFNIAFYSGVRNDSSGCVNRPCPGQSLRGREKLITSIVLREP